MPPRNSCIPTYSGKIGVYRPIRNLNQYPIRGSLAAQHQRNLGNSTIGAEQSIVSRNSSAQVSTELTGVATASAPLEQVESDGSSSSGSQTTACVVDPVLDESSSRVSRYPGAQLVEPCVAGALCHILRPCGHRVMTAFPEDCAKNCKSTTGPFANPKTDDRFTCTVCISELVLNHYAHKRSAYFFNLREVDKVFDTPDHGWLNQRLESMETVWHEEKAMDRQALEHLALERSGRRCADVAGLDVEMALAPVCEEAISVAQPRESHTATMSVGEQFAPSSSSPSSSSERSVSRLPKPSTGSNKRKRSDENKAS